MDDLDTILDVADLGFEPEQKSGRAGPVLALVDRELTEEDLRDLHSAPGRASKAPTLAKLRHSHHLLAKLLAEGKRPVECSAMTGYSASRISILQQDPAFAELIDYYRATVEAEFQDAQRRLATLGIMAVEELASRIEEDKLSTSQLISVAEMALDRSIAPPKGGKGIGPAPGAAPAPAIQITFVNPGPQVPLVIEGSVEEPT